MDQQSRFKSSDRPTREAASPDCELAPSALMTTLSIPAAVLLRTLPKQADIVFPKERIGSRSQRRTTQRRVFDAHRSHDRRKIQSSIQVDFDS